MDAAITIVIGLIILFFFIDGIRRGLIRQLFEIAGLIAAFIGAYYVGHALADRFEASTRIAYPIILFFFSAVVFLVVVFAFHLIGLMFQKIVSVTILNPVDRIGGAVLGAVKGVLFVSLVCVLLFSIPDSEGFRQRLAANRAATAIHPLLPRVYHFFIKRPATCVDSNVVIHTEPWRGTGE
jgi:membrane protein required for colicin V production